MANEYTLTVQVPAEINDERLIAAVEKRPSLYNHSTTGYKNPQIRAKAWRAVGQEIGAPAVECQKRWKVLRDKLLREKKKDKKRSWNGVTRRKQWSLRPLLEFLTPFLSSRGPNSNGDLTTTQQLLLAMENDSLIDPVIKEEEVSCNGEECANHVISTGDPQCILAETSSESSRTSASSDHERGEILNLLKTTVAAIQTQPPQQPPPQPPVLFMGSGFGHDIEMELAALSPKRRCLAKAKIHQVISDIHMGNIT